MECIKKAALFSLLSVLLCGCAAAGQSSDPEETSTSNQTEFSEETSTSEQTEDSSSAQESEAESIFPYTFTDSAGEEITLDSPPQNVAVLFSSYADIWTLAGGQVSITVGESVERGFADDSVFLVDGGAGKTIDQELLVSYEPDFVICSSDIQAQSETAVFLNDLGIPCAQFHVDSFEEYLSMLQVCTELTGNSDAYQTYGVEVQTVIDSVLAHTEGLSEEKKILFIRSGSGSSSAKAKTADQHFAAKMLEELGVYNIAEEAPVLLDGLSLEEILEEDPDYIFISTMGDEEAAKAYMDSVLSQPTWQVLTAVQESHYCYLPKDLFQFKPNARWGEAYRYLAEILYPEIDFDAP